MYGILGYTEDDVVSNDFIGDARYDFPRVHPCTFIVLVVCHFIRCNLPNGLHNVLLILIFFRLFTFLQV